MTIWALGMQLGSKDRDAGAQSVTLNATGCGFDPHSRKCNIYLNIYFHFFSRLSRHSAALSASTMRWKMGNGVSQH